MGHAEKNQPALEVEAIQAGRNVAMLGNGERIAITNWVDDEGNDCARNAAAIAVAGPCASGKWYVIDLSEFENAWLH